MLLGDNQKEEIEKKIKANRLEYFNANSRKEKKRIKEKDKKLRNELAEAMKLSGFDDDVAEKIAKWDPYNINHSADWFDPEYMFMVTGGFNIIIGNPPYINVENLEPNIKKYLFEHYKTCKGRTDIYIAFIEVTMKLLAPYGVFSYIIPYSFTNQNYGSLSRKMLIENYFVREIVDTSKYFVFETANVKNVILSIIKCKNKEATSIKIAKSKTNFIDNSFIVNCINQKLFLEMKKYRFETKDISQALKLKSTN